MGAMSSVQLVAGPRRTQVDKLHPGVTVPAVAHDRAPPDPHAACDCAHAFQRVRTRVCCLPSKCAPPSDGIRSHPHAVSIAQAPALCPQLVWALADTRTGEADGARYTGGRSADKGCGPMAHTKETASVRPQYRVPRPTDRCVRVGVCGERSYVHRDSVHCWSRSGRRATTNGGCGRYWPSGCCGRPSLTACGQWPINTQQVRTLGRCVRLWTQ